MSNTISDFIIRLKNGYRSKKENIAVPYSKINDAIAKILKREQYIKDCQVKNESAKKVIEVILLYSHGEAAVSDVDVVSKPGRRFYGKVRDLKPVMGGLGILILSTPKGVMTDKEARKKHLGGEELFKIW